MTECTKITHLGLEPDPVFLPHRHELPDLLPHAIRLHEVVVEHARRARVGEDVGIPLPRAVGWEGPVLQGGPGVVVFDEGDGTAGPHAHQAWGAALGVHQAPGVEEEGRGLGRVGRWVAGV